MLIIYKYCIFMFLINKFCVHDRYTFIMDVITQSFKTFLIATADASVVLTLAGSDSLSKGLLSYISIGVCRPFIIKIVLYVFHTCCAM